MTITAFDHVNIRTSKLDEMIAWYGDILGLYPGPRPDFGFDGAWLYLRDQALIHLIAVDAPTAASNNPSLEHFALRASGLEAFLTKLDQHQVEARVSRMQHLPIVQVNIFDPEGNHIHVDFDADG